MQKLLLATVESCELLTFMPPHQIISQEVHEFQALLSRLPAREHAAVSSLWDALLVARHDCEVMAARGVRVSRDISRDWQETVADLIDRVVAQDQDLAQLKQQVWPALGQLIAVDVHDGQRWFNSL